MSQTTASIRFLEDEDNHVLLPVTHERGVVDSDGTTLETKLAQKQATLVSGTNIKTINGESVLGSGNLVVISGSDIDTVVVSVDDHSGTPSATGTVSGSTLSLDFKNLKGEKGEQGNTGSSVAYPYELVNNLTTNDATKGLTAAMGKVLKENISLIIDALGEYAFPNGRPTLSWETRKYDITANLTDIVSSNPAVKINEGDSYTTILSSLDDLHIVDDSLITVTMGGVDVTSTVCQNGVISIAEVTGNIVIQASALTYVSSGLSLHLDCKHMGTTANSWESLVNDYVFALTDVQASDSGVVFNGTTSKGECPSSLGIDCETGTIEVVINEITTANGINVLFNSEASGIGYVGWVYQGFTGVTIQTKTQASTAKNVAFAKVSTMGPQSSFSNDRTYQNGVAVPNEVKNFSFMSQNSTNGTMWLAKRINSSGEEVLSAVTIKAIRVYNRKLSEAEVLSNYKIDKSRFGLV